LQVESPGLAGVQQNKAPTPTPVQPAAPAAEPPAATAPEPEAPVAEPPAAAPPKAPAPVTPTPSAAEGPSVFERIGEFWWVPVIVGLLVVLALIMAFLRRRRDAEALSDTFASAPPMEYDPVTARTSGRAGAHAFDISESDQDETAFAEPEPLPAASRPRTRPVAEPSFAVAAEDTLSSESAVRFDQQDALAEADFHMAYGLYDQAADLVKIAIDREPARRDLKLKLLEIYFVWGNKDLFLDTARKLHATREGSVAGEWDKVVIMGKQIAPEDAMFKGDAGAAHVDLVDVNLEGGENRVDVDLFAEPEPGSTSEGLDLEFTTGEHKFSANADAGDLDMLLEEPEAASDEEPTREMDPLARTQETPTIESPQLDRSPTVRERLEKSAFTKNGVDQTAELSLDDLGFDTDSLEATGSLEDTSSLEKDLGATEIAPRYTERTAADRALADDEMTQLAPSLSSFDRTLEAPRVEKYDIESTGTIYIDQVDLAGGGDTVEQPRPDVDSTASMQRPTIAEHTLSDGLDLDLDHLSGPAADGDTLRHVRDDNTEIDRFTTDVFADSDDASDIDLDVGDALGLDDHAPTNKQVITTEMELSELEPVTMSEVGTKLDLARAYMDMGDPDGARSILEEVLQEGTPNQKQEAQRLLESIR
jgi:pilus assembly protein FimV